ncbi:FAD-dependent monooxygenase [Paenibacillus oenotherae]|uniref:FAD-dependent monooxygenase n=2 Tax=Paenibacillus oenotherae TaxID=1435645 RepID=A0ABS7DAW9_9BACL|nr:FAD-dependent monooxygenase [Paenibacillus oenotherae]
MDTSYDVAVLGAGIAGGSMAKALADKGWRTILIDRQRFPRHKVCGEFLSPESLRSLRSLGLLDAVTSLGPCGIQRARLILSHGAVLDIPLPGTTFGVSRYALDSALHDAARGAGADIRTAASVSSLYPREGGYSIETKQESGDVTYYARAVIAAWGAQRRAGIVHPAAGTGGPVKKKAYVGIKSHYTGIEMEPVVELYFFSGGYLGICPVEGERINVAALLTREAIRHADKSVAGIIDYAASRNRRLYERLKHAFPVPGTQCSVAPVDTGRKLMTWDSIPVAGDASVMIPPLCGDGMSMALRSAQLCANLGHCYLRGELTMDGWKEEYSAVMEREFTGPIGWGRVLQGLLGVPLLPRLFAGVHFAAPGLARKLVQLTRLNI